MFTKHKNSRDITWIIISLVSSIHPSRWSRLLPSSIIEMEDKRNGRCALSLLNGFSSRWSDILLELTDWFNYDTRYQTDQESPYVRWRSHDNKIIKRWYLGYWSRHFSHEKHETLYYLSCRQSRRSRSLNKR